MIIVKSQKFDSMIDPGTDIAIFINKNNIKREDILSITAVSPVGNRAEYTIYYYGDSESKGILPGFFGWK